MRKNDWAPERNTSFLCGRFAQTALYKDVLIHFNLMSSVKLSSKKEIFPTEDILIINNRHEPEMAHWTIEDLDNKGTRRKVINAKSENVRFVKIFKDAFLEDRCLIPATAFFEWKELRDKKKGKYEFKMDEPIFAFAGIIDFVR